MQRDYKELIEEIIEITTVDGFVSACLEIKESMFFYERDLMLAAYTASLELLSVVALLGAALKGQHELHQAEQEVARAVKGLLHELDKFQFPLDIQYVVDRYMVTSGQHTQLRLGAYVEMMRGYAAATDDLDTALDNDLQRAHSILKVGGPNVDSDVDRLLGQVGNKMLRGANLRPIWLQVSPPRIQVVLLGLQTLMNNLRVTPYFTYPLEAIATERQKRKKIKGNVVSDLGVFRNFRHGGTGFTDLNPALAKDEYDYFFDSLFSSLEHIDVEPDQTVVDLIVMILETRLVHEDIDQSFLMRLLVYCNRWRLSEVSDVIIEILAELDTEDPLFYEFWSLLKSLDGKALPAMRRFARANKDSSFLAYLALFLSHGPPTKRRWSLLKEMFEHYPEEDEEKAQMAISIGRYGGAEAVNYLEKVLASEHTGGAYRERLKKALATAKKNQI